VLTVTRARAEGLILEPSPGQGFGPHETRRGSGTRSSPGHQHVVADSPPPQSQLPTWKALFLL